MIEKLIIEPADIGNLVPHWYEVDIDKMSRIRTRSTRRISVPLKSGGHLVSEVLDVPPVLIAPATTRPGSDVILNGKHRAALAYINQRRIYVIRAHVRSDIRHHVPRECYGDLELDALEDVFDERAKYELLCAGRGVGTMHDLVMAHRDLLRQNFVISHPELSPVTLDVE